MGADRSASPSVCPTVTDPSRPGSGPEQARSGGHLWELGNSCLWVLSRCEVDCSDARCVTEKDRHGGETSDVRALYAWVDWACACHIFCSCFVYLFYRHILRTWLCTLQLRDRWASQFNLLASMTGVPICPDHQLG